MKEDLQKGYVRSKVVVPIRMTPEEREHLDNLYKSLSTSHAATIFLLCSEVLARLAFAQITCRLTTQSPSFFDEKVETLLPEELVESLSAEAKEKGIHRSDLIRERLMQPPNHLGLTTNDFHKAVTKVRRRSSYGLDRQQAESLVATVFNELFRSSDGD